MTQTRNRNSTIVIKVSLRNNRCVDVPLLDRLCIAYMTEGGLENLVDKFNRRRNKVTKKKPKKMSDLNEDDMMDICAEDETSAPVESVIKTRLKDNQDTDLHKTIPYQNYFYNLELRKAMNDDRTENDSQISTPKRKRKQLNSELEMHNTHIGPTKRKKYHNFSGKADKFEVEVVKKASNS